MQGGILGKRGHRLKNMQVVGLLVNKTVTGLMFHQLYLTGAVVSVYFSVVVFRASQ